MAQSTSRPSVAILDYGSGNLRSAERAIERAGAEVTITADPERVLAADGLLVPGVGAFAACMKGLRSVYGPRLIGQRLAGGRPVLGICVGMQVLFDSGVEFADGIHDEAEALHGADAPVNGDDATSGRRDDVIRDPETGRPLDPTVSSTEISDDGVLSTPGCGEWPGTVERLTAKVLPHMGWNTLDIPEASRMFKGVATDDRVYFVHSYAAQHWDMASDDHVAPAKVTWSTHENCRFIAAVENGPLWATQFHPEKSGSVGAVILRNWVETL